MQNTHDTRSQERAFHIQHIHFLTTSLKETQQLASMETLFNFDVMSVPMSSKGLAT